MVHILYIQCEKEHYNKYYESKHVNHSTDSGFDLFCPEDIRIPGNSIPMYYEENKINLGVKCKLVNSSGESIGYDLRPRSSMGSKTPLRLSNSIGTVDAGYRGELIACVDNYKSVYYKISEGDRLIQIVAFDGQPIECRYTTSLDITDRGEGGFGSTGK
jgi:dUTP pyrophosphatase